MKKTNQEKAKKAAVFAGLLAAGVTAAAGICLCLHKEEPIGAAAADMEEEPEGILQADMESISPSPAPSVEEDGIIPEDSISPEDIIISTEIVPEVNGGDIEQPLQKEPEKTENEKPTEPPVETAVPDDSSEPPENTEIPAQTAPQPDSSSSTPQHGTIQDGKIYIDGFGWVGYNGGATNVIQADDIYENGNTVGTMD